MQMLRWNNEDGIQQKGIELASQFEDIHLFIQPGCDKPVWENCAKIVCAKADNVLEPYLSLLCEWIQDLTWPGAMLIMKRLKAFDSRLLLTPFVESVKKAKKQDDQEWLNHLSILLENKELMYSFKNSTPSLFPLLEKHYSDFCGKTLE